MAYKNNKTKNRRRYKSRYRNPHNYKAKRTGSQTRAAVLVAVLTFVVVSSLVIVFTFGDSIYDWMDGKLKLMTATKDEVTVAATETNAATAAATQAVTEPPTQPSTEVQQQALFKALAAKNNIDMSAFEGNQIIFADADDSDPTICKVYCYEKGADGVYKQVVGPYDGHLGYAGVGAVVAPYEDKTPTGVFKIEYAMGTKENPGTGIEYNQFTTQSYWITDPSSINYNRWMETEDNKDWETSQWLYEYIFSYPYAVVFDYNRTNTDHNLGCAKFLHVSNEPTAGGVGVSEDEIREILYWLNINKKPYIAISE